MSDEEINELIKMENEWDRERLEAEDAREEYFKILRFFGLLFLSLNLLVYLIERYIIYK